MTLVVAMLSVLPVAAQPNAKSPRSGEASTSIGDENVVGSWLDEHGGDGDSVMFNGATLAYTPAACVLYHPRLGRRVLS